MPCRKRRRLCSPETSPGAGLERPISCVGDAPGYAEVDHLEVALAGRNQQRGAPCGQNAGLLVDQAVLALQIKVGYASSRIWPETPALSQLDYIPEPRTA